MLVKHIPHDPPRKVIERSSRRNLAAAAENKRGRKVAKVGAGERAREGVEEDGSERAGQPEVLEIGVDGARGEDALGADETPDDGGVEEDATVGAVELVGLVLGANVCDGTAKRPFEDGDLDDAGPKSGDGLRHEHGAPWDLHVLAQFEILGEVEALCHCNVAIGLEEHHGHGATWLDVSSYEFTAHESVVIRVISMRSQSL